MNRNATKLLEGYLHISFEQKKINIPATFIMTTFVCHNWIFFINFAMASYYLFVSCFQVVFDGTMRDGRMLVNLFSSMKEFKCSVEFLDICKSV